MSNQSNHDAELDRAMQESQSRLSRLYQQSHPQGPSEITDARILAAARSAVGKSTKGSDSHRISWWIPASFAATLVLGVGIYFVGHQSTIDDMKVAESSAPVLAERKPEAVHPVTAAAPPRAVESKPMELARADTKSLKKETGSNVVGQSSGTVMLNDTAADISPAAKQIAPQPASPAEKDKLGYSDSFTNAPQALAPAKPERRGEYLAKEETKARLKQAEPVRSAEVWLAQINALIKANKKDQAWQEFKIFQKQYPNISIDAKRYPEIIQLRKDYDTTQPIK